MQVSAKILGQKMKQMAETAETQEEAEAKVEAKASAEAQGQQTK